MKKTSKNNRVTGAVAAALISFSPTAAICAAVPGGMANNPFEKGSTWLNDTATSGAGLVTAAAFLAAIIVICMAMFGKLQIAWMARIVGGLIALTGVSWVIQSIVK